MRGSASANLDEIIGRAIAVNQDIAVNREGGKIVTKVIGWFYDQKTDSYQAVFMVKNRLLSEIIWMLDFIEEEAVVIQPLPA